MGIHGDTAGYMGLQGVTGGYKGLQGVTGGYKASQGVTKDYTNQFSSYNVVRYSFLVYFPQKSRVKKSPIFDENYRLTPLEKFEFEFCVSHNQLFL